MQPDPEYLRRHYGTLSDEALLAIKRSDLVEVAQKCYDAEIDKRGLTRSRKVERPAAPPAASVDSVGRTVKAAVPEPSPSDDGERPEWLDEAAEVYSAVVLPGQELADNTIIDARHVVEAAGIPCYLELTDVQEERTAPRPASKRWRLVVPGDFNLQAASILDRDMFNEEFEHVWRAHLEGLSDDQLLSMSPEVVFCGLFDRIERVTRAYEEEMARRGIEAEG